MASPIYKLFFLRPSQYARGVAQPERDRIYAQLHEQKEKAGMKQLLMADMVWSSEKFEYFGVELFPSLEEEQEYALDLREMGWLQYIEGESFLGIPMDGTANNLTPPEPASMDDTPIYRVYLSRLTPKGYELSTDRLNEINSQTNQAARDAGSIAILSAYCRWNNEAWEYFGVERFPNLEAVLRYSQYLSVSNWYSIWESRSYLGTAVGGLVTGE
jgi:hypothetical protein